MALRTERLADRVHFDIGGGLGAEAREIRAGYGECTLCPCPAFVGGSNDEHCGNCRHHKDSHRY